MKPRILALLGAGVILVLCLVSYAPTRAARFLQDDHPIVQLNPIVHRGDWREIFRTDYWGGVGGSEASLYRPVTILTFALERGADGKVIPARAHVINVLLHGLASLALVALGRRIGIAPFASFLAGLLFALHPIHVSVVAGLVGRAEILATLFTLLALLCQSAAGSWSAPRARATVAGPIADRLASWSAAAFVFLALGSKEVALAAPLLLLALEVLFRRAQAGRVRPWLGERAAALAPTALAVVGYVVLRARAVGTFPGVQSARLSENPLVGLDGWDRFATAVGLAGRYLRLLFFPHPLSADYSGNVIRTERSLLSPLPLAGVLGLGLLVSLALAPLLKSRSAGAQEASFASLLFLVPYLTIGNLFVLVGIIFAERLIYLPSAGFCLLIAMAFGWIFSAPHPRGRRLAGAVLLAAIVPALGWKTWSASHDWLRDETVFEAAIRATPLSPRAHFTLGKIRLDQGRKEEALGLFERAAQLWPPYSWAWYEEGLLEAERGDLAEAERSLREAMRLNPWSGEARGALAMVLRREGRAAEAAEILRKALERFPHMAGLVADLGDLLFDSARYAEAAQLYRRAIGLGRSDLEPRLRDALERAAAGSR